MDDRHDRGGIDAARRVRPAASERRSPLGIIIAGDFTVVA